MRGKCPRCNRTFNNLNLHDKLSRCGRVAGLDLQGGLSEADQVRISAVGLDVAIKRRKK